MNKKYLCLTLSIFVVLSTMLACALPGQGAQPVLVITPGARETEIANTAQAAAEQITVPQSSTTESSGATTGAIVQQSPDGMAQYTDYDGGFQLTFPDGWLAVRPNSEEFESALAKEGAVNSMLEDQMKYDQTAYDADVDRLFAYALRPDLKANFVFGFSTVAWNPSDAKPIDSVEMSNVVRDLESSGDLPGFHVTMAQLYNVSSIPMMEIGGRFSIPDNQGGALPFFATFVFFKPSPTSTVRCTFAFLEDYHLQLYADVKLITASIKIIQQ